MDHVEAHKLDDGTSEAVDIHPLRKPARTASLEEAVNTPAGGKMARARAARAVGRQEFTIMRAPLGAAKIAFQHLSIFAALWRQWAAKRVQKLEAGVSVAEIVEQSGKEIAAVRGVLTTLIRNGIVRSVRTQIGWANVKARYYPTELGIQLLAMAETLGPGTSVQIGRTSTAWRSRNDDEPENVFRHAAFLRGVS